MALSPKLKIWVFGLPQFRNGTAPNFRWPPFVDRPALLFFKKKTLLVKNRFFIFVFSFLKKKIEKKFSVKTPPPSPEGGSQVCKI